VSIKYAVLIIINALFLVLGQMLLKTGMDMEQVLSIKAFFNPRIIGGLCIYVVATVIWLYVLPRVTFSIAYPLNSVAYIFSMITSYFILGEALTFNRILGTLIIIFGIFIIVR